MEDTLSENGNTIHSDSENDGNEKNVKFPFLPPSMFQFKNETKGRDGEITALKFNCLIDDCQTSISIWPGSRCSAKRHIKNSHPKQLDKYEHLLKKKQKTVQKTIVREKCETLVEVNHDMPSDCIPNRKIRTQSEFNCVVLKFIVDRVMTLSSQDVSAFTAYNNMFSCEFQFQSSDFYKNLLAVKFQERKEELIAALQNAKWVSTTTDCWSTYGKYFIGNTVQWYDDNLQRHQACLGVRKLVGKLDYVSLANNLHDIYKEFKIDTKIKATITDGVSSFVTAIQSSSWTTSLMEDSIIDEEDLNNVRDVTSSGIQQSGSSLECYPVPLFDIFERALTYNSRSEEEFSSYVGVMNGEGSYHLPTHLQCAAHQFELMLVDDTGKIGDRVYKRLLNGTVGKVKAACYKQRYNIESFDIISTHIGELFVIENEKTWKSHFDCMKCFSNLLKKKNEAMVALFKTLGVPWFREKEREFLHEYVQVLQPVADALTHFQTSISVPMSYLLPTLTILRKKLDNLHRETSIKHANALLRSLFCSLETRFGYIFDMPEIRLAAISDPRFKLNWLPNQERDSYKQLLKQEIDKIQNENIDAASQNSESEGKLFLGNASPSSPWKSVEFFSSLFVEKTQAEYEYDFFFAAPLSDVEQLSKCPTISKIFKKFNAVPSSSASVQQLFSKVGKVFLHNPIRLPLKTLDMLIFLNFNSKETNYW